MRLQGLSWKDYMESEASSREQWLQDLRKWEDQTEVAVLSTRIEIPGDHILIRPGQRGSTVVTCFHAGTSIDLENSDVRRLLLSISFDTLSDWHIVLKPTSLEVFNNRVSGNTLIRARVKHEDLPPHCLGRFLGVEGEYAVTPDFQDITDRMLERIAFLKKLLTGDPQNPRLKPEELIDDVLNAVIFLRFLEDYENAKGNRGIDLRSLISSERITSLSSLIVAVFEQLDLPQSTRLFDFNKLVQLPPDIDENILDWLPTSYRDSKQGCYEYDMSLIAEHSIGQIYDKYISLVSYETQNGKLSFFPEYESELHWQRGTGLLYTPEFIARFLVNQVLRNFDRTRWSDLRLGDLACGSGVFLRNYLLKLHGDKTATGGVTERVLANMQATDINTSAVAAARLSIAMTAYKCIGGTGDAFKPQVANSLSEEYRSQQGCPDLDVILMNPPFKGYDQQEKTEREAVAVVLGDYLVGKADYSLAFLKLAFDRLKENGCLGIVLPAAFVDAKYAAKMRKLLHENGDIQMVAKFEEYTLFYRGQTQILLMTFRKKTGKPSSCATKVLYCRRLPDLAIRALEADRYGARYEWELFVADSRKWSSSWPLMSEDLASVLERLTSLHPCLSDIFTIRQGIRMGRKRVFIIQDYRAFPVPERKLLKPLADDDNVYDWRIHEDTRRLIYAYDKGNLLSTTKMESAYPEIHRHLLRSRDILTKRARMLNKPIWALAEPRDYGLMFCPKLVSTQFGLSGSYAFDEKGRYTVTNGNLLIPKRSFLDQQAWYFYLALLNSELFMRLVARRSIKLRGGQYGFDARYTKDIPIPVYEQVPGSVRRRLADYGSIAHRKSPVYLDASEYKDAVLAAFRLSQREASVI